MVLFLRTLILFFGMATASMAGAGVDFIRGLGAEAIGALVNVKKTASQAEAEFKNICARSFDLDALAKFLLGETAFGKMAPDQQARFKKILLDRLAKSYANRFREYKGLTFNVLDTEKQENDPSFGSVTRVESTLTAPGKPQVKVTWILVQDNRIVDVLVQADGANFSMALTNRPQYQSVWKSCAGDVNLFLEKITPK